MSDDNAVLARRVDSFDGQVIVVDGEPAYELGNYLGAGAAGVCVLRGRLRACCDLGPHTAPLCV